MRAPKQKTIFGRTVWKKNCFIYLFSFIIVLSKNLHAQNINGFEIFVSEKAVISLEFHSDVSDYHFEETNRSPYTIRAWKKNVMTITASEEIKKPYTLIVLEGGRNHKLIIRYKDEIDYEDSYKNFSNLNQLTQLIQNFNNKPTIQNPQTQPLPNSDAFYQLILDAENAQKNHQLKEAKTKYEQASQIQPDNNTVLSQLKEVINQIEKETEIKYADLITRANNAFLLNKFDEAINFYNDVLKVKPDDLYASTQIQLIQKKFETAKIEKEKKQKEDLYNSYIAAGDKAFGDKSYDVAEASYNQALKIIQNDPTATVKLKLIEQQKEQDKIEEERKNNEKTYQSFIDAGNKALDEKSYNAARLAYNEALKVKQNDPTATAKLNSVNQILYTNLINSANRFLMTKSYNEAKDAYNEALKIKPGDAEASEKLSSLEKQKAQDQINEDYNSYVSTGDKAFINQSYDAAKIAYTEAIKLKWTDSMKMVIAKIELIEKEAQDKIEEKQKSENSYLSFISNGDKAFNEKSYNEAKLAYNEALKIKPNDAAANMKLKSVDQILYTNFINIGNIAFLALSYSEAKDAYNEALKIKPNDSTAIVKLSLLETQKEQNTIEEQYNNYVSTGDKAFRDKSYDAAKIAYHEALKIKSNPDIIAKLKTINQDLFTNFLNAGDRALQQKLYNEAKYAYKEALKIKQDDAVITEKLNLISREEEYNNYITAGDKAFDEKQYDIAKNSYNAALKIKPNDANLSNRIEKTDKALAALQQQQELSLQRTVKAEEMRPEVQAAREIEYNMVKIKDRLFKMGNDVGANDESPMHVVEIDSFYISRYEVTQSQWQRIMGSNPSGFQNCDICPVENISWNEAVQFIEKLNQLTNKKYRLPTEAEWEFVSRSQRVKEKIDNIGWYNDNSKNTTHPVGVLKPNALEIYDMLGNVAEWCSDWYDFGFYKKSNSLNPTGPASGKTKVVRGGSWYDMEGGLLVTSRDKKLPGDKNKKIGLRLALTIN